MIITTTKNYDALCAGIYTDESEVTAPTSFTQTGTTDIITMGWGNVSTLSNGTQCEITCSADTQSLFQLANGRVICHDDTAGSRSGTIYTPLLTSETRNYINSFPINDDKTVYGFADKYAPAFIRKWGTPSSYLKNTSPFALTVFGLCNTQITGPDATSTSGTIYTLESTSVTEGTTGTDIVLTNISSEPITAKSVLALMPIWKATEEPTSLVYYVSTFEDGILLGYVNLENAITVPAGQQCLISIAPLFKSNT